jgi:aminoglycoside phosphotransferase (APT) family kinase protein
VRRYGAAVARIHAVPAPPLGPPPWLLQALEPPWAGFDWMPEPCRLLFERLGGDAGYREAFRATRRRWSPTGLVHGDLRCANVLVERTGDPPPLWLVDWELACRGDPAWDVASVIAELLAIALLWDPRRQPWTDVQGSAAVFLGGYREASRGTDAAWRALVGRAVPFVGVKLVQTLVEIGYGDPETYAHAETLLAPWIDELLGGAPAIASALADGAADGGAP